MKKVTPKKQIHRSSHQTGSDLPKIGQPATQALAAIGIQRLEQLTRFSEKEILQLHGMGPKAFGILRQALADKRLAFRSEKEMNMNKAGSKDSLAPSQYIDKYIGELDDWRGKTLARLRKLILEAAPELSEEWKWDTPVWAYKGNVVAGGVFKDHVKLNFFKGASLRDPKGLFNSGLEAKATRAIDFHEGEQIDEPALQELVRAAVAFNGASKKK